MNKVKKLTDILNRLNRGENPEKIKEEAKDFLSQLDPRDLSMAEQKLIEAGLSHEDLRNLCEIHMEVLRGQLEKMKAMLKPGHVIHTMVEEHDLILGFLRDLEKTNNIIQYKSPDESINEDINQLKLIAEHLLESEFHHKREEDVVFPAMEERGVSAPQKIMRMEHEELRAKKRELKELAENAKEMDLNKFKEKLDSVAKYIVFNLREHIFKENNILYPTAIEIIDEKESWNRMKEECDKIGYCCFTPER